MAIQFFNGPLIYNKLVAGDNRFRKLADAGKSDTEIITELHLAAVNRTPTEKELAVRSQTRQGQGSGARRHQCRD